MPTVAARLQELLAAIADAEIQHARKFIQQLVHKYPLAGQPTLMLPATPEIRVDDINSENSLATHRGGHIYLSEQHWNPPRLEQYSKEWQGLVVDSSVEGVLTHEFGHLLLHKIEDKLGHKKTWNIVYKWLGYKKGKLVLWNNKSVSPYAQENIFEFMAEAFVTYHSGGKKVEAGMFSNEAREIAMGIWTDLLRAIR